MARLVSYKAKDENQYSTFGNENECNSNENLTESRNNIKIILSKKGKKKNKKSTKGVPSVMPSTHRKSPLSASRQYVQSTRHGQKPNTENISKKSKYCCTKFGRCFDYLCCCFCCTTKRCKFSRWNVSNNDDEDDIDAYFERYKNEMKLKATNQMEMKSTKENVHESSFASINNGKTESQPYPNATHHKYWNWNDSLRSNSDKFLETLEYDMDGEQSLKRNHRYPVMPYMKGLRFFIDIPLLLLLLILFLLLIGTYSLFSIGCM